MCNSARVGQRGVPFFSRRGGCRYPVCPELGCASIRCHVARMAGVTDKVLPHLEAMPPKEILDRPDQVDRYDRVARRNYGLDKARGGTPHSTSPSWLVVVAQ